MSSVRTGALSRSIAALAFDTAEKIKESDEDRARESLAEYMQQFQIPVKGTIGGTPGWANIDLDFDIPMLKSASQRSVPFEYPTISLGYAIETGMDGILTAYVRSWKEDEAVVNGALVRVGLYAPEATVEVAFSGTLHMTFQGFGAVRDDIDDSDEPVIDEPPDFIEEAP